MHCAILGVNYGRLPHPRDGGRRRGATYQPYVPKYNPTGHLLGDSDEFLGDGLSQGLLGNSLKFSPQELRAMSTRNANSTFPDRTLFIVIVSILSAIALLLLCALIALCFYAKKKGSKQKYQVQE